MNGASTKLAAARFILSKRVPYFTRNILALVPHEDKTIETMAVSALGVMYYNPDFVRAKSPAQLATVYLHEAMHLILKHSKRMKRIPNVDHSIANIATDMEINDDLVAAGFDVTGGILPSTYGMPENLLAEEYYARLCEQRDAGNPPQTPQGNKAMGGSDGSGAGGNPVPSEQNEQEGTSEGSAGEGPQGRTEVELDELATEAALAVNAAQGNVPSGWKRWAKEVTKPAKVRWEDKLARVCRNAVARVSGETDVTYSKFNRKQGGLGYRGAPILAGTYRAVPRVAVVMDTSGSMDDALLSKGLASIADVFRVAGAEVTFVACDAIVHAKARVKDWREARKHLKGGGGTDFRPAFDALAREKADTRPEVVVFVTDGYGTAPSRTPKGMHTIWVITPGGVNPAPWGETVKME